MTARRRPRRDDAGAAALEFALVLPVLVAVVGLGVFAGWLGLVRVLVDRAAEAGLDAAVRPAAGDHTAWPSDEQVEAAVRAAMPLVEASAVTVGDETGAPVRNATVAVTVVYEAANPLAPIGGPARIRLSATATGRRE